MACSFTLNSLNAKCDTAIGGIKRILIGEKDNVPTSGVSIDSTTGQISGITRADGTKLFYEWKFRRNTGAYTSTVEVDPAIGNASCTTEVTLQFTQAEADKRLKIQNAINDNCVVIVETVNGEKIFLGYDNEVIVTNAVMQSGTANTDLNGFTLTFQDVSKELPMFISSTFNVDSLLAAAV